MRSLKTAILIAGPTAGGKSELALRAAERLGGTVINADSMAVYRDLAILTGRPMLEDLARAPHALYGHREATDPYSVGIWLAEVASELSRAEASGTVPIVVGGTGLFFKTLTQGLSEIPAVPEAVRARVRAEAEGVAPAALHARLAACDPLTASRLRPTDPQRIVRAMEVFAATGSPLASFQARRSAPILPIEKVVAVALVPARDALKARIDARFERMLEAGAITEVERLRARGLDPALPAMRALGVPPLLAHLDGRLSREDAAARAKAETRAYARRQVTFLRHQLPDFSLILPDQGIEGLIANGFGHRGRETFSSSGRRKTERPEGR